jgi:hypothetical protein
MKNKYPEIYGVIGDSRKHEKKVFLKSKYRWKPKNSIIKNNNFRLLNLPYKDWTFKDFKTAREIVDYFKKC